LQELHDSVLFDSVLSCAEQELHDSVLTAARDAARVAVSGDGPAALGSSDLASAARRLAACTSLLASQVLPCLWSSLLVRVSSRGFPTRARRRGCERGRGPGWEALPLCPHCMQLALTDAEGGHALRASRWLLLIRGGECRAPGHARSPALDRPLPAASEF